MDTSQNHEEPTMKTARSFMVLEARIMASPGIRLLLRGGTLLAVLILLSACATRRSRTYVNPETDFPAYRRVAVVPFENLTKEEYAGEQVTDLFLTEFMIGGEMEVVEPSLTLSALSKMGIMPSLDRTKRVAIGEETLRSLGEQLDAQAVLTGSVEQFGDARIGAESFPIVAVSVNLVDTETGTVIWRVSHQARGGPGVPFIGTGESYSRIELAQKVCQQIVKSVAKELRWIRKSSR